ncbi:hypothetical protein BpHYR1_002676 [Brachionus plicatilis]|uniref:Uncharacterized protein n=1 Tax=Brachionus plicatilis TaxID=10195 RepID=A0A3M7R8B5_BRAPC|nr:hypothetical protein BpHYR1_002676 [Brachionus plicatilis]
MTLNRKKANLKSITKFLAMNQKLTKLKYNKKDKNFFVRRVNKTNVQCENLVQKLQYKNEKMKLAFYTYLKIKQ